LIILLIEEMIMKSSNNISCKKTIMRYLLVSTLAFGATSNTIAITPEGSGGGASPPPQSPPVTQSQPAKTPSDSKGQILMNPQTAEEMRQALGRGGSGGRDMASLNAAGFGSFIEFNSDSATVIPGGGLHEILKALTVPPLEPNEHITITGHTDSDGSDAYNMDLSYRRANAVRAWLITNGVRPDALRAVGLGERQPIADNATAEGKRQNRRVEFSAKSW
jgi:outer membrane protein OmpA-like peptidoglycan-associated protein